MKKLLLLCLIPFLVSAGPIQKKHIAVIGLMTTAEAPAQIDTRYLENGTVIRTMEDGTTTRYHEQYVLVIRTAEDGTTNRLLENNTTERTHER